LILLCFLLFYIYRFYRQKITLDKQQMEALKTEQENIRLKAIVEGQVQERQGISQEMHDDMGSGLTSILFLSHSLKKSSADENVQGVALKLGAGAQSLMEKMNEIIWMIARCFAGALPSTSTERCRITCKGVCDSRAADPSFSGRRSRRQRHVTGSDIKRVRLGIASFLCDVHFLRAFSSRDDTPASRSAQRNSFISDDRTIPCASCRMLCDRRKWNPPKIFAVHPADKIAKNIRWNIRSERGERLEKLFLIGGSHRGVSIAQERSLCPIRPDSIMPRRQDAENAVSFVLASLRSSSREGTGGKGPIRSQVIEASGTGEA